MISGTSLSLLGCNWLNEVPLDCPAVHPWKSNEANPALTDVLDNHPAFFEDSQQAAKTDVVKIYVTDTPGPCYWKARNLAYMMRDLVSNELDRLLAEDIIEAVQYSQWVAPIVPVMKADHTVSTCGNYKLTLNQVVKLDRYPISRIEDLNAQLGNGTYNTKLDIHHAYEQIPYTLTIGNMWPSTHSMVIYAQTSTLWDFHCPWNIPACDGHSWERHSQYHGVLGWHPDYWINRARAPHSLGPSA